MMMDGTDLFHQAYLKKGKSQKYLQDHQDIIHSSLTSALHHHHIWPRSTPIGRVFFAMYGPRPKMVRSSYGKRNFMQPIGRPKHALKAL
jgi:hypothetical protein